MILKSAINRYLNQRRDDHRWMKDLTRKEIDGLLNELRPKPKLWPTLEMHQKVSFLLAVAHRSFSFWIDMGGGKTLLSLELVKYWQLCGELDWTLVFVLSDKAYPTWENQVKKFKVGLPVVALEGSSDEKWAALQRARAKHKRGIILTTYPGAVAMCHTPSRKRGRKKWKLSRELLDELGAGVNMVVLDESTRLGNDRSLSHQMCEYIGDKVDFRYALAGRPFGRDPVLVWAQQRIIDGGESLGEAKGMFQAAFYSKERNRFARSKWAFDYTFKKSMTDDLSRMMQHRSITFEEHEYRDAPRVRHIQEPVAFTEQSQEYYEHYVKQLMKGKGDFTATKQNFLKMRQVTSGFIGAKDDETGAKVQLKFDANPKLERLIELIDELDPERKAVVFYDYTWSGRIIAETIKDILGIKPIWLWSGTKNARKELKRFTTDPKCRVAVINNKVGAYSLDGLQEVANYIFYYESPISVVDRDQSERRVNRPGQKRVVYIYDLVVPNSVDTRILAFHKEGRDLMTAVRKDPRLLLGG